MYDKIKSDIKTSKLGSYNFLFPSFKKTGEKKVKKVFEALNLLEY